MIDRPVRVRQPVLIGAIAALLALGGAGAGAQTTPLPLAPPIATIGGTPSLEDQLALARAELQTMTAERDRLRGLVATFDDLYAPMEADRQLLIELRKPLPEERSVAQGYLERLQRLANQSDPARLGLPATRVLETAPTFLDWRDQEFAAPQERDAAFLSSGASGFGTDFEELKSAILLTVANRLDALLSVRDRIR